MSPYWRFKLIDIIKSQINLITKDKLLFDNFSYLTLNQFLNQALPFIYFPYIAKTLGPKYYGLANYALAITLYFSLVSDFGFNFSAMRMVAINRDNQNELGKILLATPGLRFILFSICAFIFAGLLIYVDEFSKEKSLFLVAYLNVLGNVFNSFYFFQGLEKIKNYFYLTIFIRIIFVILIFMLVKEQNDYVVFVLLNSLTNLLLGLTSFIAALFLVKPSFPTISFLKKMFVDGARYFVSAATINLYTASNAVILGIFSTKEEVGFFTAADKIRAGVQSFLQPVSSAIFPRSTYQFSRNLQDGLAFINKIKFRLWIMMFALCFIVFVLSNSISDIFLGPTFSRSSLILKIIAFAPLIISISNIYGVQILLAIGRNDLFLKATFAAAVFNIIFAASFAPLYGAVASAISFILSEIIVALLCYYYAKKFE